MNHFCFGGCGGGGALLGGRFLFYPKLTGHSFSYYAHAVIIAFVYDYWLKHCDFLKVLSATARVFLSVLLSRLLLLVKLEVNHFLHSVLRHVSQLTVFCNQLTLRLV